MSTLDDDQEGDPTSRRARNGPGLTRRLPYAARRFLLRFGTVGSALLLGFVMVFPIYWMAQNAFKTRLAINQGVTWFPSGEAFTLERFDIINNGAVVTYITNSIIVTVGTIVMVVAVSLVAGYGLARYDFRGKVQFARFLLLGYLFSPIVLALPLYLIWRRTGLLNTHIGLIIALSAVSMPFAVWLMWKYIQTIPEAMEESAWIAGAPRWRGFVDVILPQTKPAIIANALFAFGLAWNDFTFAQILLPSNDATTFPPGILRLVNSSFETGYGDFMAVGLLMTVPPLLFAFFLQSYLLKGFEIRAL
ncbi:carbohydrate ABC transporter permease [Halomarina salina]|uniref:Carbohydrate ABC transporter permease n=1 Tax=Halomarina salina TaxID=1872699 RepID=A0ABD5RRB2_9EURY